MPVTPSSAVFVVLDPLFEQHRSRGYHPERPERLGAARRGLERCAARGIGLIQLPPRDAKDEEILRAHTPEYLATLKLFAGHHASLDADTYLAPITFSAALRAAGGAMALTDAILAAGDDAPRQGVALVRPPGHHAMRGQGMGFCVLNNVAIAAHSALARGLARVAIVDLDVHHGNGTQDIFWADPRVLFVSLHEMPLYPGTGRVGDIGTGAGTGYTLNLPLPAAATDAVYRLAFEEVVLPRLRRFAPELVLISAGYDAHVRDPLGSMQVSAAGFGWMIAALAQVAASSAGGRTGLILEGGYDLTAIETSMEASILGLMGGTLGTPEGDISPGHRRAIDAAREVAREQPCYEGCDPAQPEYAAGPSAPTGDGTRWV